MRGGGGLQLANLKDAYIIHDQFSLDYEIWIFIFQ